MSSWHTSLDHQLEELTLIKCSLLPGERFTFILPPLDLAIWTSLLDHDPDGDTRTSCSASLTDSESDPPCPARFEIRVEGVHIWFEVELPRCTDPRSRVTLSDSDPEGTVTPVTPAARTLAAPGLANTSIAVKGENISRDEQERWNAIIRDRTAEIQIQQQVGDPCEFPIYELLTLLLPLLHDHLSSSSSSTSASSSSTPATAPAPPTTAWHALLTSHHLLSTTKRRLMSQWSHDLPITGFAKIGYPGIIYAEGSKDAVGTFVGNVKGMQWLALRVRFQEPVPTRNNTWNGDEIARGERWVEVSKVGEVLEQMRRRGREALVTSLGIGASSRETKQS